MKYNSLFSILLFSDNSFFPNKSDDKTRSHGGETDFNVNDDFDCMITGKIIINFAESNFKYY